jgi:hypothetical protein
MDWLSVIAIDKLFGHFVLLELWVQTLQPALNRFDLVFIITTAGFFPPPLRSWFRYRRQQVHRTCTPL